MVCLEKGIKEEDWLKTWKLISNQSQQQLGAFVLLYLLVFKSVPKILNNDDLKFRNAVIHKGNIPEKDQVIDFGQTILNLVRPILKELKSNYSQGINQVIFHHSKNCRELADDDTQVWNGGIRTILSLPIGDPNYDEIPLKEALLNKDRWWGRYPENQS